MKKTILFVTFVACNHFCFNSPAKSNLRAVKHKFHKSEIDYRTYCAESTRIKAEIAREQEKKASAR